MPVENREGPMILNSIMFKELLILLIFYYKKD